jgi:WD40 repeat protein
MKKHEKTFLSYARQSDSAFALRLAGDLRKAGGEIWLDQLDIEAGSRWDSAIEGALQSAKNLIVVLSPASVNSHNVLDEVSYALEEGKTVIPVLSEQCVVPLRLRRLQRLDFTKDYDAGLRRLIGILNLGEPAAPSSKEAQGETVRTKTAASNVTGDPVVRSSPNSVQSRLIAKRVVLYLLVFSVVIVIAVMLSKSEVSRDDLPGSKAITVAQGAETEHSQDPTSDVTNDATSDVNAETSSGITKPLPAVDDNRSNSIPTLEGFKELFALGDPRAVIWKMTFSPDGKLLAVASDNCAKVWDVETQKLLVTLNDPGNFVWSASWNRDGRRLATGGNYGARVWDIQTGEKLPGLDVHGSTVSSVAWSPDGKSLAFEYKNDVKVWDFDKKHELVTLHGHHGPVNSIAWKADGTRLATGSSDNTAKVWDAKTGEELVTLRGHLNTVGNVAWSHDGKRLATASADHTARVWDAHTGRELLTLRGHAAGVWDAAWSPNDSLLVTGSYGGIKLWNAKTGKQLSSQTGDWGDVWSLSWDLDGKRVVSGGSLGGAKFWAVLNSEP